MYVLATASACAAVLVPLLAIFGAIAGLVAEGVFGRRERALSSGREAALQQRLAVMNRDQARQVSDHADEAARIAKGLVIEGSRPLSAERRDGYGAININSFTVRFIGSASCLTYCGGSITALTLGVTYYVYADDPTRSGGAVTYNATTTRNNALIGRDRIYIGSIRVPD